MSGFCYWYDCETTGLDSCRDQIIQFAGQRTDEDLNPLGQGQIFYCRLAEERLPALDACLTTGITPQVLEGQSRLHSERELAALVEQEMTRPGTLAVAGYNSLRFDDQFVRNLLYRNFHDPYEREWKNGNSRWDIIDMVRLVYALRPDAIKWPMEQDKEGREVPGFRLQNLTCANDIEHLAAHDALSDVQATIALARLIKQREPRLYDYCWGLRNRPGAQQQIKPGTPILHISRYVPRAQGCLEVLHPLLAHPTDRNAIMAADLGTDYDWAQWDGQLPDAADGDGPPLRTLRLNATPMVAPLKTLKSARAGQLGLDMKALQGRAQSLEEQRGQIAERLQKAIANQPRERRDRDAEDALYDGFLSDNDRRICRRVRADAARDPQKLDRYTFDDPRLGPLLFRYRARNFPQYLSDAERDQWRAFVCGRLHEDTDRRPSMARYLQQLAERADDAGADDSDSAKVLAQLREYAEGLMQLYPEQP